MKDKILVMFSGGLDSTYLLHLILQDTRYKHMDVEAHHIRLFNVEKRVRAEEAAIEKLMKYFQSNDYRKFELTFSNLELPSRNNRFMWDSDAISFTAGYLCSIDPSIKSVVIGMNSSDIEPGSDVTRFTRSNEIFCAFTDIEKLYPLNNMSKHEIFNSLPDGLRKLTWSCRTPVYNFGIPVKCGRCKTCLQLK